MSYVQPTSYANVTVTCKANVYFDGKVVSHTLVDADGHKTTLGLIYPGSYTFNTAAPERMEIVAGSCRYRLAGHDAWTTCLAGEYFDVPGNSAFEIAVADGIAEYICSFG